MMKPLKMLLAAALPLTLLSACGNNSETAAPVESPKTEAVSTTAPATSAQPEATSITAPMEFPKPIGKYTVGRTQMDFKYTASDQSERDLTALFFYPADSNEGKPAAEYAFPEFQALRDELLVKLGAPAGAEVLFNPNFKTWVYEDLALSGKEKQYPVIFYVHGAGAYPQQGTLYAQDLASSGYIVVSIGHPGSGVYKLKDGRTAGMSESFMDDLVKYGMEAATLTTPQLVTEKLGEEEALKTSRQLTSAPEAVKFAKYANLQSEDVSSVADRLYELNTGDIESMFKNKLQLDPGIGIFGHSFGGTTAALVSRDDDRFVGAVNLDGNMLGALDSDLKKPFLQLGTVLAYNTNAFLLESNSRDTYFAIIDNVVHADFSDSLFTATGTSARGTRDALDQRNIITTYTKAFFDNYLLKQATDLDSLTFDGVEMIKKP
ncbi:choline esterase [Paenibacillus sp. FSL R7-0302]|uniref:alpha/beta hydrolase n=1 Tax=Paenibacillus sp. FSL R7-0302 TaxID=2921681 RepID=UPI0030F80CCB